MIKIKQKKYTSLEVDTSEKDIIQIFMNEIDELNVIQIERGNIETLIEILYKELTKN